MRISDWSSDVCSSDLIVRMLRRAAAFQVRRAGDDHATILGEVHAYQPRVGQFADADRAVDAFIGQIGDAIGQIERDIDVRVRFEKRCDRRRSEEHTSELQSLMRISYAVFCLKKKNKANKQQD